MGDIREKIEKLNAKWMEYVKNKDVDNLATIYTEDSCLMLPNMPMVQGREALKMVFKGMFDSGVKEINLKIGELIKAGDYIIERSSYTQKVQPPGMEEIEDVGKYVIAWKKTPAGYKIFWDIVNSDLPPPPG